MSRYTGVPRPIRTLKTTTAAPARTTCRRRPSTNASSAGSTAGPEPKATSARRPTGIAPGGSVCARGGPPGPAGRAGPEPERGQKRQGRQQHRGRPRDAEGHRGPPEPRRPPHGAGDDACDEQRVRRVAHDLRVAREELEHEGEAETHAR